VICLDSADVILSGNNCREGSVDWFDRRISMDNTIYHVWLCLAVTTSTLQITGYTFRYLTQSQYETGHLSSLLDASQDNEPQPYRSSSLA